MDSPDSGKLDRWHEVGLHKQQDRPECYNGQKVTIAFKYVSTDNVAPTWEVQNVVVREKVAEGEGEEGGDAETPAE